MAYRIAIRFAIRGDLRFLSHQDSMRLFERVAVRAELPLHWSAGFNPRPRLSLPLPRPVGVASEDELLVLELEPQTPAPSPESTPAGLAGSSNIIAALAPQMPADVELLEARLVNAVPQARLVTYRLKLHSPDESLPDRIAALLAAERCVVSRQVDAEGADRPIDIRPFIESIDWSPGSGALNWALRVTGGGSARPGEVLEVLSIDPANNLHHVVRERVQWSE